MSEIFEKLLEKLNVEVEETFYIKKFIYLYKFDSKQRLLYRFRETWFEASEDTYGHLLKEAMKNDSVVIKPPRISEEEMNYLKGFNLLGFNFATEDEDGKQFVWKDEPFKTKGFWGLGKYPYKTPIYLCLKNINIRFGFLSSTDKEPFEISKYV